MRDKLHETDISHQPLFLLTPFLRLGSGFFCSKSCGTHSEHKIRRTGLCNPVHKSFGAFQSRRLPFHLGGKEAFVASRHQRRQALCKSKWKASGFRQDDLSLTVACHWCASIAGFDWSRAIARGTAPRGYGGLASGRHGGVRCGLDWHVLSAEKTTR